MTVDGSVHMLGKSKDVGQNQQSFKMGNGRIFFSKAKYETDQFHQKLRSLVKETERQQLFPTCHLLGGKNIIRSVLMKRDCDLWTIL